MAKLRKLTVCLSGRKSKRFIDVISELIAMVLDIADVSYTIEYSEEDCPDEQPAS